MSAAENPILNAQATTPPDRLLPKDTGTSLQDSAAEWAARFGRMQSEIRDQLWYAYSRTVDASESFMAGVRERSRRLKDERPLTLLGIITGMAFAAGAGIAVWRSRRS